MATSMVRSSRVTLTATRLLLKNDRSFSTCPVCFGNSWLVRDKDSRLKEIYNAPVDVGKFAGKGDLKHINIPDKIERSPTAILEALASTVNNNYNQPIYKSIDDPHLYAIYDIEKKQLLAAKDGGEKAAQMMISMYPDYFTQLWDEPVSEAFRDANLGFIFKDASEEALLERISKLAIKEAIQVYKELMASKNIPSQEAQEKLLELLTVFNCEKQEVDSDLINYASPLSLSKNAPFPASTWEKGNIAEEVFNSLPHKTAKAYCYMIRGMAVNNEKEGAMSLYQQMKDDNLIADTYTYNKLLRVVSLDLTSMDEVIESIEILLRDMANNKVRPNVETFNSLLSNSRRLSRWNGSKRYALRVMREMKDCGIEPQLSTYCEILDIFYYRKDNAPKTPYLLEKILDEIEGKEFQCTYETDAVFFKKAMSVINVRFPDSKYALRLHKVLKTGRNGDLLGHRQIIYSYYNDLFSTITPLEHTDVVMELYSSVVPFTYSPAFDVYEAIVENIKMHDTYRYLPQLYADLQFSGFFSEQAFTDMFTRALAEQKHEPQLQGQLCDVATSIWHKWLEATKFEMFRKPYMDGEVLGHLMLTFLNGDQMDKAWELFELYHREKQHAGSDPSEASLTTLAEKLIQANNYDSTKKVLECMQSLEYAALPSIIEKALQTFNTSEQEQNYLKSLAADFSTSESSELSE